MVNQERNVFAALLVALGVGDAMISGLTRTFAQTAREVNLVLDPKPGALPFGVHMMVGKNHTTFLADTTINERPDASELAHIARSEEHTSELQSLMRISYAVFCLNKKKRDKINKDRH